MHHPCTLFFTLSIVAVAEPNNRLIKLVCAFSLLLCSSSISIVTALLTSTRPLTLSSNGNTIDAIRNELDRAEGAKRGVKRVFTGARAGVQRAADEGLHRKAGMVCGYPPEAGG